MIEDQLPTKSNPPDNDQNQANGDVDGLIRTPSRSRDLADRERAAAALGQAGGPQATKALIRALRSKEDRVRGAAANALWWIGDEQAVGPLIRALDDPDSEVTIAAAKALGQIKDPSAVVPLTKKLQMKSDTGRMAAAEALGDIGDPRALDGLTRLLLSRISKLRETSLNSLVQIDPEWTSTEPGRAALARLITRLGHSDPHLRRDAVTTLGQIGKTSVAPVLVAALNDSEPMVHRAAVDALIQLGALESIDTLARSLLDEINTAGIRENGSSEASKQDSSNLPWIELEQLAKVRAAADQMRRLLELHSSAHSTAVLDVLAGLSDRKFRYHPDPYDPYEVESVSLEYNRIRRIASNELERRTGGSTDS